MAKPKTEHRVYGPPGTGKTRWSVRQASRFGKRYGSDQVSICSLTRAAVHEVGDRSLDVDEDNITTLHARCKRSLHAGPPAESHVMEFKEAFPQLALPDKHFPAYMLRVKRDEEDDTETGNEVRLSTGQASTYEQASVLRQIMRPVDTWPSTVRRWYQAWDGWCRDTGRMDFTGWLEASLVHRPLPHQELVLVDEAQDHTPLQLAVIRQWPTKVLVLVGDDDQNLYEWSGAKPQAFFEPELPSDQEQVLSQSWRVPRAVHEVATRWIKQLRTRKVKEYFPRDADGQVNYGGYTLADAESGDLPPMVGQEYGHSVMFLASCGFFLDPLIDTLQNQGIPYHNPYRLSSNRWNPLKKLAPVMESYLNGEARGRWTGLEAQAWIEQLNGNTAFVGKKGKSTCIELCEQFATRPIEWAMLANLMQPQVAKLAERRDVLLFLQYGLKGNNWDYAAKVYGRSRDQWKPTTIVGTVHSVKGGQADHVYFFPELSYAGDREYQDFSHRDRIVRLGYVGMTRAKETLTLCEPTQEAALRWR